MNFSSCLENISNLLKSFLLMSSKSFWKILVSRLSREEGIPWLVINLVSLKHLTIDEYIHRPDVPELRLLFMIWGNKNVHKENFCWKPFFSMPSSNNTRAIRVQLWLNKTFLISWKVFFSVFKVFQLTFTFSKLRTETLKKVWNMFKVNNKNTRTTSSFWYFYY